MVLCGVKHKQIRSYIFWNQHLRDHISNFSSIITSFLKIWTRSHNSPVWLVLSPPLPNMLDRAPPMLQTSYPCRGLLTKPPASSLGPLQSIQHTAARESIWNYKSVYSTLLHKRLHQFPIILRINSEGFTTTYEDLYDLIPSLPPPALPSSPPLHHYDHQLHHHSTISSTTITIMTISSTTTPPSAPPPLHHHHLITTINITITTTSCTTKKKKLP